MSYIAPGGCNFASYIAPDGCNIVSVSDSDECNTMSCISLVGFKGDVAPSVQH